MLGGFLSAHCLATQLPDVSSRRDYIYLTKSIDLAERLLGAYESDSGIPFASINLRFAPGIASHADGGASSTAEASTLQMEVKYLAHLTGKEIYWREAEEVMKVWMITVWKMAFFLSSSTQIRVDSLLGKFVLEAVVIHIMMCPARN
jgi:endoplasmic reticulum Man9GlcNAc2 1,2-alpha-mannosidase